VQAFADLRPILLIFVYKFSDSRAESGRKKENENCARRVLKPAAAILRRQDSESWILFKLLDGSDPQINVEKAGIQRRF